MTKSLREMMLEVIKQASDYGDEELLEWYGTYEEIEKSSDEDVLEAYTFLKEQI